MFRKSVMALAVALCCLPGLAMPAAAAQVDCDSVYCFSPEDFGEASLAGICITELPQSGTVMLDQRILRPGDILTADQVARMTFAPLRSEVDQTALVEYLPIFPDRVEGPAQMTLSIRGKEDKAPVAEDFAVETYRNLPNTGKLKVQDPEGQPMTYTVIRQPKRGEVTVSADGTFTYTPKKNKIGVDSFVYTATDPAGKVSREATVTVTILKPTDGAQYTDTVGEDCRFAAEWMRHTGIFAGESLVGNPCFSPEKEVTRGEFVTMLVKTLEIQPEEAVTYTGYADEVPLWLEPYLAAAVRSGLTAGLPEQEVFGAATAITGAEAAVMLHNALDLAVISLEPVEGQPQWAQTALDTLAASGIQLQGEEALTRGQAAQILYQASRLNGEENRFETQR